MSELLLPLADEAWKKPPVAAVECVSHAIDAVSQEILVELALMGPLTLRELARTLQWSPGLILHALEQLRRDGLVRLAPFALEVRVEVTAALEPWLLKVGPDDLASAL